LGAAVLHRADTNAAQALPPDFGVRFEYGLCTRDVLDTFKGVFIRDMGSQEPAVSIPLKLSDESIRAFHAAILAAKFADYPEVFRISGNMAFAPAKSYKLEARIGGTSHTVAWTDNIGPSTPEADRLRDLFSTMISIVQDHPEVKRLPRAKVSCA